MFRDGLTAEGMQYVLDVPPYTPVWPAGAYLEQTSLPGTRTSSPAQTAARGAPERRGARLGAARGGVARDYGDGGSAGAADLSVQRRAESGTRNREPGGVLWAVYRQNLDGSEPRYYLSNGPEDTPLETLAHVGGSRWPIETEFETEKSDVGLDEYETRTWAGWHHHITLCLLAGAFLLSLQQDWGKKMPQITRPQVYRVVWEMLPRERFGPDELLRWLEDVQRRNERPNALMRSGAPPVAGVHRASLLKVVVVILGGRPKK